MSWADRHHLQEHTRAYRVFGYDSPAPKKGETLHGYTFCLTVDDEMPLSDEVEIGSFSGGLYAVTPTTVAEIGSAWDHFVKWLAISKYRHASYQCLEEHLVISEEPGESTPIDLYLPIAPL